MPLPGKSGCKKCRLRTSSAKLHNVAARCIHFGRAASSRRATTFHDFSPSMAFKSNGIPVTSKVCKQGGYEQGRDSSPRLAVG
jgi:hypothetical protein